MALGDLTATFTSDSGLVSTLGLGEIIPLEVDQITAFFDDADDDGVLTGAEFIPSLSVRGTIESDFFPQAGNDGFQPFVIVGELPVNAGGDVVTIDDIVEFLEGTPVANVIDSIDDAPTEATKAVPGVTEFQFGVAIVGGRILPFDIPQISIGFTGLDLGVVEAAASSGSVLMPTVNPCSMATRPSTSALPAVSPSRSTVAGIDGNASISLQGEFRPGSGGDDSELDVRALAELSFSTPASLPGFQLDVQNAATAQFEMLLSVNDAFEFSLDTLALSQASVGSVTATFGGTVESDGTVTDPLLRLAATDINLDLRDGAAHLLTFGSVSAALPGAPIRLPLQGEVVNFAIDVVNAGTPDARIGFKALDGFGISFMIPEGFLTDLGIPDIIEVTEFGFQAKPAFNDPDNPDYTAFVLSVSASLDLPIGDSSMTADLDNLTIDVGQLASGDFFDAIDLTRLRSLSGHSILVALSSKATCSSKSSIQRPESLTANH